MPLSSNDDVSAFYDEAADSYNDMMNEEIKLPLYDEVLGNLSKRVLSLDGSILDTSCGPGHMLDKLRNELHQERQLLGLDLSPKMIAIARERLGNSAVVSLGDMRDLVEISDKSCAAIISFFSLHHISSNELVACFAEWQRVLVSQGQLVIATWEGEGAIDYGDQSEISAQRYKDSELIAAVEVAGFRIDSHSVRSVEGFEMDAVHIIATKSVS